MRLFNTVKVAALLMTGLLIYASPARAASDSPPRTPGGRALYERAVSAGMKGRYQESISLFRKLTQAEPSYAPAYNGWGLCLYDTGQAREALDKYRRATELDPKLVKAYYNWGVALSSLKDSKEAEKKFQMAARLDPSNAPVLHGWAMALADTGRYGEAIEKLRLLKKLNPGESARINELIVKFERQRGKTPQGRKNGR